MVDLLQGKSTSRQKNVILMGAWQQTAGNRRRVSGLKNQERQPTFTRSCLPLQGVPACLTLTWATGASWLVSRPPQKGKIKESRSHCNAHDPHPLSQENQVSLVRSFLPHNLDSETSGACEKRNQKRMFFRRVSETPTYWSRRKYGSTPPICAGVRPHLYR